jgi:hypothetical protein
LTTALIRKDDPQEALRDEAHERYQRIIELGAEIQDRVQEQALHVLWFYRNPEAWRSLGYQSFKEFFFQEDIQQALELNATSQGAQSIVFGKLLVKAAVPEAGIFGEGHSKLDPAMPLLRPMAAAILEAPPEKAKELKRTLLNAVNEYRSLKYREVVQRIQTRRPSPYHLTANSNKPAIAEIDEDGVMDVLLVQTPDCDPAGAGRAMARMLKSRTFFTWDEEGIWTQIEEGVWKLALRWARDDIPYKVKEKAAEACKAEERA